MQEKLDILAVDVGRHTIVRVAGHIDSHTAPGFEKYLLDLLGRHPRFGLDCRALDYVSSAGLRSLLVIAKRTKGVEGRFEMFGLNPMISRLIEISSLTSVLSIHASEDAALAALQCA